MIIFMTDWNTRECSIEIPELNFYKSFGSRYLAEKFIEKTYKNYKIEQVVYS